MDNDYNSILYYIILKFKIIMVVFMDLKVKVGNQVRFLNVCVTGGWKVIMLDDDVLWDLIMVCCFRYLEDYQIYDNIKYY